MRSCDAGKRERDRRYNAKRPEWSKLYKTPQWRAKAARQLKEHPHCRLCLKLGRGRVPAAIADHVEAHRGDVNKFWRGELQSLCRHCHNAIKQAIERGNQAGCDQAGQPTDPNHPWA